MLAPLPVDDLPREARATGAVLVADETRRAGGVSEGVLAALADAGFDGARAPGRRRSRRPRPGRRDRPADYFRDAGTSAASPSPVR
ncbi:hypothetical protein F8568_019935 [Actinomadura sp. LD22]|uniref:Uncharacterized protein n=1 Tax=Actinomadura physcomitrii TaxID=2650748 RepID=A0A6I4MEE8_9ACTN|nr:hypothetical protein [Actinomadura physcomitrii]MWA02604.1 hypothetical protein [Actinomadura physcomitrii]